MASLVALIPLLGTGVLVVVRDRQARVRWGAAVGLGVLQLLVLLAVLPLLPTETELTAWAPSALFHGRILLKLDVASWMIAASASAVWASYVLFSAAKERSLDWPEAVAGSAYLGLSIVAFLAGNLLTVALAWAAVDALAFIFLLGAAQEVTEVRSLTQQALLRGASTLVIVAGGIPEAAGGGGPVTEALEVTVLSLAVWLRCGLWPIHGRQDPGAETGLVGELDTHFPAAMALAALAKVLGGTPPSGLAWIWVLIGGSNALFGGLGWYLDGLRADGAEAGRGLVIGIGGLALLTVAQSRIAVGVDFAWWAAVMLVIGALDGGPRSRGAIPRTIPRLLAGVLFVGPGVTLGADLLSGNEMLSALRAASGALILLGSLALSWGTWRRGAGAAESGQAGTFAGGAAVAGLLLPACVLVVDALVLGSLLGWPGTLSAVVALTILVVAEFLSGRQEPAAESAALQGAWTAFERVAGRAVGAAERLGRAGEGLIRLVARFLEGSAALLWVLVVVLVVGLIALGG